MQINSTSEQPRYRTGTLTGITFSEIQQRLPDILPDTRPSGDRKVTITWLFLADGKPCGIWDCRKSYQLRGELSTFGPDEVFTVLFGKTYTAF